MINSQKKRQSTNGNPSMTQVLELSDRFLGPVSTMLQEIKANPLKMNGKTEVLSRGTEPIKKKKQVSILELKNTMQRTHRMSPTAKGSHCVLGGMGIIQSEEQREKELNEKMNRA